MNGLSILIIALGLSMDAFAVSIASGVIIKKNRRHNALKCGLSFGFFQMVMPIIGWAGGWAFRGWITGVDHWLAFGLLSLIGAKMIYEAVRFEAYEHSAERLSFRVLLGLSVATSMDALAVGLSFAFMDLVIWGGVFTIGLVTFVMSYAGFMIGNKFGHIFEKRIEIFGGLLLICIAFRILLEHLL